MPRQETSWKDRNKRRCIIAKDDIYLKVAEKLGYPGSPSCVDYLKVVMAPEEAELLIEFIEPATCQDVAKRLNMDEKSLQAKLDDFMSRGLLFHGKTQYVFQFGIHVFWNRFPHNKDENIPPGYMRAWREFDSEEMEKRLIQSFSVIDLTVLRNRVIPHRLALAASPKIRPEQVLWYEDYAAIFRRAKQRIVVDCPDRRERQNCDRPLWVCFYLDEGCTPDLDPKRQSRAKVISAEEAIAYSDIGEQGGLMHLAPNNDFSVSLPGVLCNCCECCCSELGTTMRAGRLRQIYAPSRFVAIADKEVCTGCQECVARCFFNAIEMRKTLTSKKKKAHVISGNCMGCGSCVVGCKQKALTLELVRTPEHIPSQKAAAPFPFPRGRLGYAVRELK